MTVFIAFVLTCAGALLLIPAVTLAVQVIASLAPLRARHGKDRAGPRDGVEIVIPAHDEAAAIGRTVAAVKAQMRPADRLVVVADNCSDATADVARAAGAEVFVRNDRANVGKAYALAAGVRHVDGNRPRSDVVFLDADCLLGPGALDELAHAVAASRGPVQGRYVMSEDPSHGTLARINAFAWRVRNDVRPRGNAALGAPCHLMGTGMAIPIELLRRIDLATGHITEDLLIGIQLAIEGHPARYCPEAEVVSDFAPSERGRAVQKERWVHGHLAVIADYVPRLVAEAIRRRRPELLAIAADLMVPPLALFGGLQVALVALSLVLALVTGATLPLVLSGLGLAASGLALAIAWWRAGRTLVPLGELAQIPIYMVRQAASGLRFLIGRRSHWVRSERS